MSKLVINSFDPNAEFEEFQSDVEGTGRSFLECSQLCAGYLFAVSGQINSTCMDYSWLDDNGKVVAQCLIFSGSELNFLQKIINIYKVFTRIQCKVLQLLAKITGNNKVYIAEKQTKL